MKVIVAMDSFKGCLGSAEAGAAVRRGIMQAAGTILCHNDDLYEECDAAPDVEVILTADGGEGTAEALRNCIGGKRFTVDCHDALMRPVKADIILMDCIGDERKKPLERCRHTGGLYVAELAESCGITRLGSVELSAMHTSTYGFGEQLDAAMQAGAERLICCLGGSATNDGGIGAMQALGLRVFTDHGEMKRPVTGADLQHITAFDKEPLLKRLAGVEIICLYDADIPFTGPCGAVSMYSGQKGADESDKVILESGMRNLSRLFKMKEGIDIGGLRGGGAAGGTAGGFAALAGATLLSGIEYLLQVSDFDSKLEGTTLVITGEGKADTQTRQGKTAQGILARCRKAGVPVILLAGKIEGRKQLIDDGYAAVIDINAGYEEGNPLQPDIAAERLASASYNFLIDSCSKKVV